MFFQRLFEVFYSGKLSADDFKTKIQFPAPHFDDHDIVLFSQHHDGLPVIGEN